MTATDIILAIVVLVIGALLALFVGYWLGSLKKKGQYDESLRALKEASEQRLLEVQTEQREALREAREETARFRATIERENAERRSELQRQEHRIQLKEEALERKLEQIEQRDKKLTAKERQLEQLREEVEKLKQQQLQELERISQLTEEQAKEQLLSRIEQKVRTQASQRIRMIEDQARVEAETRAREIITLAIQRCASDQVAEAVVSVVPLPNDEMKGRIIGREGRNIRALEAATGVDLIIDDTPEAVILSGFDPVRREVARIALTKLIIDGRIHPARIEDVVAKARQEVDNIIREAGENAAMEANVHGLQPDLLKILGRLHFRTSYGQNVLAHSVEVSILAATMAHELGADVNVCKTAALLHDLGKAVDQEVEGPHAIVGGEIVRRFGKSPKIIHAIVAHHASETEPQTLEAAIVQAADAISAARPGARRETVDLYIKRLEALEHIANSFTGVEKSFAIQAGREIRIIVKPEEVDEYAAAQLASDIAHKIEESLDYPGQIKVCVVRETRSVDYAR
ncbi:ribonuclease Y [Thermosporothrix hazakensis]|uniref:Ribonuclease Y n=2 Tax=Thermosporothrix TaxID=768650 RepID=A0A326TZT2_THEHA|nr:ribonuclease Y [Thermosporothrix hazakensis]PZW23320.1 ribonuclease Y [Thermosporothrix hazakensis]BBH89567.1 ribonuclease Y [Thermosporothrix sp. COM3]GCE47753.1 ribonuclease Y [Thermosporothrix hazakensis]